MFDKVIVNKARANRVYAQNLYAALAGNTVLDRDGTPVKFTYRTAAMTVANMINVDYLEIYQSGYSRRFGFIGEGTLVPEVVSDVARIGIVFL